MGWRRGAAVVSGVARVSGVAGVSGVARAGGTAAIAAFAGTAAIAAFAGIAAIAVGGCRAGHRAVEPPGPRIAGQSIVYPDNAAELASLSSTAVEPAPPDTVRTTGRLAWDEDRTVRVFPPVGGRVRQLLVGLGQRVAAGAPLAAVESPDFGQAQADAGRAQTDLAVAERSLARVRELYEHQAAPKKDLEAAEADRDRARVESERARSHLALLGGGPGTVDQRFLLRSPLAGVVVDRDINPGLEVRPDATSPLFVVSDPERLWVYLDVIEQDLARIRAGQPLVVHCNAYPQRSFAGRVEVVGDALDPATRTVKARGSLANPQRLLKAEMYVDVEVFDTAARSGLEVPSAAVIADGARRYVFVEEARGRFERRQVVAGGERAGKTQILAGIAPGQRVVVDGSLLLESLLASGA
jgi:cobalt-zinc-cadmium efflux system membrane fusion protein